MRLRPLAHGRTRARRSRARGLVQPELLAVIVIAIVVAALSASSRLSAADVELTAGAGGSLTLSNSKEGSAILALGGMRPGDSVDGTLTIGNTGTVPGDLSLSTSNLVDSPGAGGGALSGELDLVVNDVTNPASPLTVYTGKIAALTPAALGTVAPGTSRDYEFRVSFPDAGPGAENAYQGSSMSVQFDWTATNNDPDTVPPETTITSAPGTPVASGEASFSFAADEPGSTFECSLDGAPFGPCTSPATYSGLADGGHSFEVRATDTAANVDPSPAQQAWTVDTTPPSATLNDPGAYLRGTVTLTSTTSDAGSGIAAVTYQRSPAGTGSWVAIGASWNTTSVTDGLYDLRVVATDAAGNSASSSPVTGRRVDNTKPKLISSAPPDGSTVDSAASLSITASEDAAGIANATLDGAPAPAQAVSGSTITLDGPFADGPHTLAGELEDLAGNRRPIRVHFTVWSLAAADYPYVEKNSLSATAMSLRSASDTTTVTVPAAGWTGAPAGDWLVVRIDPSPAPSVGNGFVARSEVLDVTAYWALSGSAVHDFAKPLEIEIDSSAAKAIPATFVKGAWRPIAAVPGGGLPSGWEDGFVREDSSVRILSRHLSLFTLLEDVRAPTIPAGFKGTGSSSKLRLAWRAASDNSGLIAGYRVYANGALLKTVSGGTLSTSIGSFETSDTRSFQVAAVDEAGNVGPKSYALSVVPDLSGLTLEQATAQLAAHGLTAGSTTYVSSSTAAGHVVSAGLVGVVRTGTAVPLTVSSGDGQSPAVPPTQAGFSGSFGGGAGTAGGAVVPQSQPPQVDAGSGEAVEANEGEVRPGTLSVPLPEGSSADGESRLRELLGLGLLGLAFAIALFAGLRLYRPHRENPAMIDGLEPILLWDARLLRAATSAVRRIAGRS